MISDNELMFILTYDRMRIIDNFSTKKIMKFLNVVYVFEFMISLVTKNILENKKMHFNIEHCHLYRKETSQIFLFSHLK